MNGTTSQRWQEGPDVSRKLTQAFLAEASRIIPQHAVTPYAVAIAFLGAARALAADCMSSEEWQAVLRLAHDLEDEDPIPPVA